MKYVLLIVMAMVMGCAVAPILNDNEKRVRILMKSDAPAQCQEVGSTHIPGVSYISDSARKAALKQKVYRMGGDTATVDRIDDANTWFASAFKCRG